MSEESKYNPFARELCGVLGADVAIVLVTGGVLGNGCARAERPMPPEQLHAQREQTVRVLRAIADDIEQGITQPDQAWARRGNT